MAKDPSPATEAPTVEGERHVSEVASLANPARKKLGMAVLGVGGLLAVGALFAQAAMEPKDGKDGKHRAKGTPLAVHTAARPFEPSRTSASDPNAPPLTGQSVPPLADPNAPPLPVPAEAAPPLGNAAAGTAQAQRGTQLNLDPTGGRSSRLVVYGGGGIQGAAQSVRAGFQNASFPTPTADGDQSPATELSAALNPSTNASATVRASLLRNQPYLLTAGTIVPCTLQTAMDSTLAGFVTCIIPQDIVGKTGLTLFDRGTRVIGEFQGGATRAKPRLFVLWTRAETPQGVVINLNSPAADPVGRAGLPGGVDNRFWDRFGAALLMSTVDGAIQAGVQSQGNGSTTINTGQTSQVIDSVLRDSINLPPVIRKNQGETVSIFVRQDLDFSSVYGLANVQQARVSAVRK